MFFVTEDGGLTTAGYVNKKISAKQLAFAAVALALATVCSNIRLFRLPMGGAITLFSMLFVTLIGYWYGSAVGLMAGVAYGLLQMIFDTYVVSLPQVLLDYPLAFGALGLSGFFSEKKNGLVIGYLVAITGRFLFSVLSGVVFFGMYAPETMSPLVYSVAYNGSIMYGEGILTIILLMIPAVKSAMVTVKAQAKS